MQKNEVICSLFTSIINQLQMDQNFNIRRNTLKVIEEKVWRGTFQITNTAKDFVL